MDILHIIKFMLKGNIRISQQYHKNKIYFWKIKKKTLETDKLKLKGLKLWLVLAICPFSHSTGMFSSHSKEIISNQWTDKQWVRWINKVPSKISPTVPHRSQLWARRVTPRPWSITVKSWGNRSRLLERNWELSMEKTGRNHHWLIYCRPAINNNLTPPLGLRTQVSSKKLRKNKSPKEKLMA